ncbi:MAG: RNA polymerase-associated protein RapA [Lentisphaeria bacterium]|nr:RNA polymerase-associated protein RapA [Lentisphaeria bacterium]NQZ69714.1 RNA polymerase-associated protein RapA [Lentisphaeria bacterium]
MKFSPGQRWISQSEVELGLGIILTVEERTVQIMFPVADEMRSYASASAPLTRVSFKPGDSIKNVSGDSFTIDSVEEKDDIYTYISGSKRIPEAELSGDISFSKASERFKAEHFDPTQAFNLRYKSQTYFDQVQSSKLEGLLGARIDLIPHQLYVSNEICNRYHPRVLLSDEVGLGKTIEACLVLQRLLLTGRINRVLILLPDALVNQWFVELRRRFNLTFTVYNEEQCDEMKQTGAENIFEEKQNVIMSIDYLLASGYSEDCLKTDWDILLVDEAHHLEWSESLASPAYTLVEKLAKQIDSLLLITATPEQYGLESHFARLRLIDPGRYESLETFINEQAEYQKIAAVANDIIEKKKLSGAASKLLTKIGIDATSDDAIKNLIDHYGPGRSVFRNVRSVMENYPDRLLHSHPLDGDPDTVNGEFHYDCDMVDEDAVLNYKNDARLDWLEAFIKDHRDEKILLICRSIGRVQAIDKAIQARLNINLVVFHEGLNLLQRDRHAAFFADEEGAQILLCSEIGSEGRNFQFSHHLILFDLPFNPELIEQRIGRLDRIGQKENINIHVPYIKGSHQQSLFRWYNEGFNLFTESFSGAGKLFSEYKEQFLDLYADTNFDDLISRCTESKLSLDKQMHDGRNRLLELHSFNPEKGKELAKQISEFDNDWNLHGFFTLAMDQFGVLMEDAGPHTFILSPDVLFSDELGMIPDDGMTITFSRDKATSREDWDFMSWDHPMVRNILDLMTSREKGNSVYAVWPDDSSRTIMIELIYRVYISSKRTSHMQRFLSTKPIRIVINHNKEDCTEKFPFEDFESKLKDTMNHSLFGMEQFMDEILPAMFEKGESIAAQKSMALQVEIKESINTYYSHESERLIQLQKKNSGIRDSEIRTLKDEWTHCIDASENLNHELDAIRLIWKGPE